MDNYFPAMKSIAAIGIAKQKRNPGDFIGSDGFLRCGCCGEKKQDMRLFPNPDMNHMTKLLVAVECLCDKEAQAAEKRRVQEIKDRDNAMRLRSISLMDRRFREAEFRTLQVTKYNAENLKKCRNYVENFDIFLEKNYGLLFWGDVGTGKSFAAAAIANELMKRSIPVVMTSFVAINKAMDADASVADDIIARIKSAKLVIFDDLGAERNTGTSIERVNNIIDLRCNMKLPMIITTNFTLDQMKTEEDIRYRRIYDRIFQCCPRPMQFTGPSWRRVEANKAWEEMGKLLEG